MTYLFLLLLHLTPVLYTGKMDDPLRNERLHATPSDRLRAVAVGSACIGAASGLYEGIKSSSLRYLTENAHRLPTTVGGWYFYHKRKNYVMITSACRLAVVSAAKFSAGVSTYFLLEALLDEVRGTKDFLSSAAAGGALTYLLGYFKHMTPIQRFAYARRGLFIGMVVGIAQDGLMNSRGGDVWYAQAYKRYRERNSDESTAELGTAIADSVHA